MLAYIIRRLVYGLVTLLALSFVVFVVLTWGGGSPLDRLRLNPRIKPETIQKITEALGLDKPWWQQYGIWLRRFVTPKEFSLIAWPAALALAGSVAVTAVVHFGLTLKQEWWPRAKWAILAVLWVATIAFMVPRVDVPSWLALGAAAAVTYGLIRVQATEIGWWSAVRAIAIIGTWIATLWFVWSRLTLILDWGESFRGDGPVFEDITVAAGATFRLGFMALFIALLIGIPLGIYQATKQYSFFDQLGTTTAFFMFSTPIFVIGIGLSVILGLYLERWTGVKFFFIAGMTSANYDQLSTLQRLGDIVQHLTLPALSIAAISLAGYSRFQRASMLEVLHSDYLRTAKAKGLSRRRIIVKHALRNALIPVVTLVSLDIATIVGGAIITESIFGWPGVGRYYIDSIRGIDYPGVMAVVMAIGIGIVLMNVIADLLYGVLDPRVRYD